MVIWKAKTETRHDVKKQSTNLIILKMIIQQRADEKSQLKE